MDRDRKSATVSAAEVILTNIMGILSTTGYSLIKLERALSALGALDWAPGITQQIGITRVTRFFTRLKQSRVKKSDYRFLIKTLMIATPDKSAIFPFDMEEWRRLIVRFDLFNGTDFPEWLSIIAELTTRLIETPAQLALFSYTDAFTFSLLFEKDECIMRLWQAACIASGASDRANNQIPFETNSSLLAQSIRAPSLAQSGFALTHKRARLALDVPDSFDTAGPAAKIRLLSEGENEPAAIQRFLSTGVAVNILRQSEFALPGIASGIQCWTAYCDLQGYPYYPPTSARVCAWASIFNPGRSFGQYLSHLIKGCQIIGAPTDWNDDAVSAMARGLRKAQNLSFAFENYIFRPCLVRFINHETLQSEFGLLGYLSFLFLLRVQSEGIPIRRASLYEPLLERAPQLHPALIGVRDVGGESRLILKLSTRKNTRYGAILMRPCFCQGSVLVPGSLCPVHVIWPIIRERVLPNDLIFPSLQRTNLNRMLKVVMAKIGFSQAERYTMYAFRRGCLMEMKRAQSTVSEIMRTAGWTSAQFKTYLDLQEDEEAVIRSLMRTLGTADESGDEGDE